MGSPLAQGGGPCMVPLGGSGAASFVQFSSGGAQPPAPHPRAIQVPDMAPGQCQPQPWLVTLPGASSSLTPPSPTPAARVTTYHAGGPVGQCSQMGTLCRVTGPEACLSKQAEPDWVYNSWDHALDLRCPRAWRGRMWPQGPPQRGAACGGVVLGTGSGGVWLYRGQDCRVV